MPNSIITHLQNQPILADEQEKIVNDPAFKKCLSDYEIRLLYLPDVLRDISWNLVNNQISVFLYDKINKMLYLADQYNKSYF